MSTAQQRALHLVQEFKRLTLLIKACKPRIGEHLDQCRGVKGHRKDEEEFEFLGAKYMAPTQEAMNDQETHLKGWFTPESDDDGRYFDDIAEEHEIECPHCFAAYRVIRERKALRRSLAGIKGAMTKFAGGPQ